MSEKIIDKIWKRITYYARQSVFVRIPAIIWIASFLFFKNLIVWGAIYHSRTRMRQRVAIACAVCLVFVSALGQGVVLATGDEGDEPVAAESVEEVSDEVTDPVAGEAGEETGGQEEASEPSGEVEPSEPAEPAGEEAGEGGQSDGSEEAQEPSGEGEGAPGSGEEAGNQEEAQPASGEGSEAGEAGGDVASDEQSESDDPEETLFDENSVTMDVSGSCDSETGRSSFEFVFSNTTDRDIENLSLESDYMVLSFVETAEDYAEETGVDQSGIPVDADDYTANVFSNIRSLKSRGQKGILPLVWSAEYDTKHVLRLPHVLRAGESVTITGIPDTTKIENAIRAGIEIKEEISLKWDGLAEAVAIEVADASFDDVVTLTRENLERKDASTSENGSENLNQESTSPGSSINSEEIPEGSQETEVEQPAEEVVVSDETVPDGYIMNPEETDDDSVQVNVVPDEPEATASDEPAVTGDYQTTEEASEVNEEEAIEEEAVEEEAAAETEEEELSENEVSEADEKDIPDDVICVRLPTSFSIPMINRGDGIDVVSDNISVYNNSTFPVDVNITSVDVDILKLTGGVYNTVLECGGDRVYDLEEMAEFSRLKLQVYECGGVENVYDIDGSYASDVATFTLGGQSEESAKPKEFEELDHFDCNDHAIVNFRGCILDGLQTADMSCTLEVKVTFDFRKHEEEVNEVSKQS